MSIPEKAILLMLVPAVMCGSARAEVGRLRLDEARTQTEADLTEKLGAFAAERKQHASMIDQLSGEIEADCSDDAEGDAARRLKCDQKRRSLVAQRAAYYEAYSDEMTARAVHAEKMSPLDAQLGHELLALPELPDLPPLPGRQAPDRRRDAPYVVLSGGAGPSDKVTEKRQEVEEEYERMAADYRRHVEQGLGAGDGLSLIADGWVKARLAPAYRVYAAAYKRLADHIRNRGATPGTAMRAPELPLPAGPMTPASLPVRHAAPVPPPDPTDAW